MPSGGEGANPYARYDDPDEDDLIVADDDGEEYGDARVVSRLTIRKQPT